MKGHTCCEYDFTRNTQGRIDFSNIGPYLDNISTRTTPMYESESWFLVGVATVKLPSGGIVRNHLQLAC